LTFPKTEFNFELGFGEFWWECAFWGEATVLKTKLDPSSRAGELVSGVVFKAVAIGDQANHCSM
jgi:hypothetical protein